MSSLDQTHTELLSRDCGDPDIVNMVAIASTESPRVGYAKYSKEAQAMYWFVAHSPPSDFSKARQMHLKCLCIREPIFGEVLELFNQNAELTEAEKRVTFQLTAGLSLQEAAVVQGVSIETKRAQFKKACAKLDCNGQSDLIRLALSQIAHLTSVTTEKARHTDYFEDYVRTFITRNGRLRLQRLPNGRAIRYLSLGPENGTPVVLVHRMLFPLILFDVEEQLERLSIRLYIPVRAGYLEPQAMANLMKESSLAQSSMEDIRHFIEHNFDQPISVLAQSLGCQIGISLCKNYPHLVTRLGLLSVNHIESFKETSAYNRKFFDGLRALKHHSGLFRYVTWQFRRFYINDRLAAKTLTKMFSDSSADVTALNKSYSGMPACSWFSGLFKQSILGIADDVSFTMQPWKENLLRLKMPVTWFHGEKDQWSPIGLAEDIAQASDTIRIERTQNAGHLIYASHAAEVWQGISAFLKSAV